MKLYVSDSSESSENISALLQGFNIVEDLDCADCVLILPGGLGTFNDLFRAINLKKRVVIYNKDLYYSSLFKNLFQGYERGYIEFAPSEYLSIESELENVIGKLEENENERINNGKNGKLL